VKGLLNWPESIFGER